MTHGISSLLISTARTPSRTQMLRSTIISVVGKYLWLVGIVGLTVMGSQRRFNVQMFLAAIIVTAIAVSTLLPSTPAEARTFLSDCINRYNVCYRSCWSPAGPFSLPPPEVGYCYAKCAAIHAACVDRAFSPAVQARMRVLRKAY